ncbi:RIP metalloprotease RseP [Massilia horti]|uniref:Zinc metalloprotease n=1 Tax=Massilia horti TaxID=2562153 RepID=A0A4Y9T190_9BURK|nr:RIP metalloprotease RseP [Massilia horti]TFW32973.1 RIP metalloprotease RseP [Massilia horti]
MNLIHTILAFLVALGFLILFHELGHYWVARLCGVKVLRFSIGMGKVVWSRRFGPDQTEWALSALPIGGYVKMLDARDPSTAPKTQADFAREFTSQKAYKRIAIVAAGPLANFILAIVVLAALSMHGVQEPSTRLRAMPATSAAYQAGVRGGDTILAVNDEAVASMPDLRMAIVAAAVDKREARLEVRSEGGNTYRATIPASKIAQLDVDSDVLGALGIAMWRPRPTVEQVIAGGPAEHAGLEKGDLIVAVNGKALLDGVDLVQAVRASSGRTLQLEVQRSGRDFPLAITPERDASGHGVIKVQVAQTPEMVTVSAAPLQAFVQGARKTWETAVLTVKLIGKMIVGQVSWKNVSGPITIADVAGQTASAGATPYLQFIAFVSISLGVMNLLPIPVLDGWLLLYYSLEVLTGRPLPERFGEVAQRAGVGLLFMLMALAVFNDLARLL